jgi:hypothetical protein
LTVPLGATSLALWKRATVAWLGLRVISSQWIRRAISLSDTTLYYAPHIVPLTSRLLVINLLASHVALDKLTYKHASGQSILMSDGSDWHIDL